MTGEPRVSYQGEAGAFSEAALLTLLPNARPIPRRAFVDVVDAVVRGEDEAGLLPVENTLAGGVVAAFDALHGAPVHAVAEVVTPIRHCLLGVAGASMAKLREVRSHPVALAQCQRFFADHPDLRAVAVHDTAGAAREVSDAQAPSVAAIAGCHAASRYGLEVLARDLQDRDDNQTRFLLVRPGAWDEKVPWEEQVRLASKESSAKGGTLLKTSLMAETANRPGALHTLLGVFAALGLDLTFIESRPAGTPWTYRFILDFTHPQGADARRWTEAAVGVTEKLRILGTFPAYEPRPAKGKLNSVPASGRQLPP